MYKKELELAIEASVEAGKKILEVYHSADFHIEEIKAATEISKDCKIP